MDGPNPVQALQLKSKLRAHFSVLRPMLSKDKTRLRNNLITESRHQPTEMYVSPPSSVFGLNVRSAAWLLVCSAMMITLPTTDKGQRRR